MPWDWRTEGHTARKRRQECEVQREKEEQRCLEREKHNSIDQYLLSGDEKVMLETISLFETVLCVVNPLNPRIVIQFLILRLAVQ